ncbi:MAG: Response regulator containing a CheY-like receiver domain and a domain protein [Bacteroidetes bacterium]|jgi:ligand-binding sensor domain-containing protein/serine phosphatase RsbU (regulator of sigma subunit)|nr:Response regulator containing a CheY-like receiver domain and a domain protein [Bacteroidota bacterium]
MRRIRIVHVLVLLFAANALFAQRYNFKTFNTKHGLANSSVNAIFQSAEGYIWFATQGGGLSRFDGKTFKNYSKDDGLISNDILSIYEDDQHNIWVGTIEGLSHFNGKKFTNYGEKDGLGTYSIYGINKFSDGNIWVSTFGGGVKVLKDGKVIRTLDSTNALPTNNVFCALEDKDGSVWVGLYYEGLINISKEGKVIKRFKEFRPDLKYCSAFSLTQSKDGTLWIGTAGHGIYKYTNNAIEHVYCEPLERDFIGKIIIDKLENVWVAADNGLLRIDKKNQFKLFREKEGLSSIRIQALCEDYEGNIWIGTYGGGVCMFRNEAIVTYSTRDGLSNNKIYAVLNTSKNLLMAGSLSGLDYFDGEKFVRVDEIELFNQSITFLLEDKVGNIWVATESDGVVVLKYENGKFRMIKHFKNLKDEVMQPAYKIVEDKDGIIWVSTYGHGLFKVENMEAVSVKDKNITSKDFLSIHCDENNKLYAAVNQEGVYIYDGASFSLLKNAPAALATVFCITGDNKGNIFFGTQDGGVVIYSKGIFKEYNTKNGLCSNLINGIDYKNGELWIGTDKGVNRLTFKAGFDMENILYYDSESGFSSNEINQNGVFIDNSKNVWFCTIEGITRYNSTLDWAHSIPPKLVINDIKLSYQHVDWSMYADSINPNTDLPINLSLSYKNNNLSFSFQATTLDNIHYQFMLEGYDDDWTPSTTRNEAVYTNIPPGQYTFKVKAINSSGVWSNNDISYSFKITPPFWKTWWFYSLCVVAILAGIITFIRYRTAALENEKKILEQKVEERTVELKESNHKLFDALHDIKDSINYAERIQRAMLPADATIRKNLSNSFILFKPRDIVSGDFYWFSHKDGMDFIAAVDCTGHGVPGAFMSMVGSSLLNEIVLTKNIADPSEVLSLLNRGVQDALKQRENQTRDGMDLAFCAIDYKNRKVQYAGANRALWIIRNSDQAPEIEEIKATKCAIGGFTDESQHYTTHEIQLKDQDTIYMSSDGYADQFGGANGKKLMTKRFKEILLEIQKQSMAQQHKTLDSEITSWMGDVHEQVDDILVVGIKF